MTLRNRRAFSLSELSITLLVMMIVVSAAFAAFRETERVGNASSTKTELLQIAADLSTFRSSVGFFPDTAGDLKELVEQVDWTSGESNSSNEVAFSEGPAGLLGLAVRSGSDLCVSATVVPPRSTEPAIRDVFEIGAGVDDDGVRRGPCTGAEALNRTGLGANSW